MIKKKILTVVGVLVLSLSLVGCMHIEQNTVVNEDGSGTVEMVQAFLEDGEDNKDMIDMMGPGTEEPSGTKFVKVEPFKIKKQDGNYSGVKASFKFDDIKDMDGITIDREKEFTTISFSDPVKDNSNSETIDISELDEAFLKTIDYKFTMTLPGDIVNTNGTKKGSRTVTWDIVKMNPEDKLIVKYKNDSSKESEESSTPSKPVIREALELQRLGLLRGTEKGLELERTLTRAEGTVMIRRIANTMGLYPLEVPQVETEGALPYVNYSTGWDDVPAWAKDDVFHLGMFGVVRGSSETKFSPNQEMKAIDFTTMTLRMLGYDDSKGEFSWVSSLDKAVEVGLITLEQRKAIKDKPFTRESMSIIAYNVINLNK